MERDPLAELSREQLIDLVLGLAAEVAELKARLGQPPKTPGNSSVPPSVGLTANRAERRALPGLDLSRLVIRQAYLQEVETHDSSLAGSEVVDCVIADAFEFGICVALSPDGSSLAAGTTSGELRVWRVDVNADGQIAASGNFDGTIRLWDAATGECQAILRGRRSIVRSIGMNANGRYVATGSFDGAVRVWDTTTGMCQATLRGDSVRARHVALSGDGRLVAGGDGDGKVRLWEVETGFLRAVLQGHAERIRAVALNGDGRLVATGSDDCTVRVWDSTTGACARP